MTRITEQPSRYNNINKMTVAEITHSINKEDKLVAITIEKALPQINALISVISQKLLNGGRLFYVGAGSGGRLSVLDAIELPTTFGVDKDLVVAVLAGGNERLLDALEEKEDDETEGWMKLQELNISVKDVVVGISASGSTPFVLSVLKKCNENNVTTGCIVSNPASVIAAVSDYPIEIVTGPEFITGSTRMKCGTMQKMILDMISTTTMIQLGRVEDNMMVNVKLINKKIIHRAVKMLMDKGKITDYEEAKSILVSQGSVRSALEYLRSNVK